MGVGIGVAGVYSITRRGRSLATLCSLLRNETKSEAEVEPPSQVEPREMVRLLSPLVKASSHHLGHSPAVPAEERGLALPSKVTELSGGELTCDARWPRVPAQLRVRARVAEARRTSALSPFLPSDAVGREGGHAVGPDGEDVVGLQPVGGVIRAGARRSAIVAPGGTAAVGTT